MTNKVKQDNISFNDILSGRILLKDWITKHIWFILFCVCLSLIYIKNSYQTANLLYEITNLQKELNVLRNRSVNYTVKLQELGREKEVNKLLHQKGIKIKNIEKPITEIIVEHH